MIFAYTVKGYGLATEGHPQNHSSLLTVGQFGELAERLGDRRRRPVGAASRTAPPRPRCARDVAARLRREPAPVAAPPAVPADLGRTPSGTATTQAALGRALLDLTRAAPEAAAARGHAQPRTSAQSTNLGGWVNKVGVWAARERVDWFADDPETILHWRERPTGQHLELGIAETNLVGLLGELGATWSRWGAAAAADRGALRPVRRARAGAVVVRHLRGRAVDPGRHAVRGDAGAGGRRAPVDHDAVGRAGAARLHHLRAGVRDRRRVDAARRRWPGSAGPTARRPTCGSRPGPSTRRSPRVPDDPAARERRRRQVVAGAYLLRRAGGEPAVTIAAMGASVPEALAAADRLAALGHRRRRRLRDQPGPAVRRGPGARRPRRRRELDPRRRVPGPAGRAAGDRARRPSAHAGLPRRASTAVRAAHLGVTRFGQSGDLESVYRHHGLDADSVVAAALDLV